MDKGSPGGGSGFERRSRAKRELILETALTLFTRGGFRAVSVAEIARAAGVSQVTIYKYFTDKGGLVEAVVLRLLERKSEQYRATFALDRPFRERFALYLRQRTENSPGQGGELVETLYEDYPTLVARIIEERKRLFAESLGPFLDEGRAAGIVDAKVGNDAILAFLEILAAGFQARKDILFRATRDAGFLEAFKTMVFHGFVAREGPAGDA